MTKNNEISIQLGVGSIICSVFSSSIGLVLLIFGFFYSTKKQSKYTKALVINFVAFFVNMFLVNLAIVYDLTYLKQMVLIIGMIFLISYFFFCGGTLPKFYFIPQNRMEDENIKSENYKLLEEEKPIMSDEKLEFDNWDDEINKLNEKELDELNSML